MLGSKNVAQILPAESIDSHHSSDMEFIRHALDSAAIVAMTDVRGAITFVNKKFCEISGYSPEELIGSNHRMLQSGVHDRRFFRSMYRAIARGRVWQGELCNRKKDGSLYWVDTTIVPHLNERGLVDSYTAIRFDVSARHLAEERLREATTIDPLTGISNRRQFQSDLDAAIDHAKAGMGRVHLVLIDVDMFKEVNDTLGHFMGDHLLKIIASRLTCLPDPKLHIARLGGDEFGIVIQDGNPELVETTTDNILAALREPITLAGSRRRCSVSMGVAAFPCDAESQESLFKAADLALYRAKALGRDRCISFTQDMREGVERKAELAEAIEAGLATNQFELHYQPMVPSGGGKYCVEALLRWQHPEHGLLPAGKFLTSVEDPGILAAIGQYVIDRVMDDIQLFDAQNLDLGRVAINLSNADFRSDEFVDTFLEKCQTRHIDPDRFCIEVTEGVFLGRNFEHVTSRLTRMHQAGVHIALDDFGTGFASLTHLRNMPIDRIKIDRSFVANLPQSAEDMAIVRGIVDIATSLGKDVTAEGVETATQAELLTSFGCGHLQGWHFAKAVEKHELANVIKTIEEGRAVAVAERTSNAAFA